MSGRKSRAPINKHPSRKRKKRKGKTSNIAKWRTTKDSNVAVHTLSNTSIVNTSSGVVEVMEKTNECLPTSSGPVELVDENVFFETPVHLDPSVYDKSTDDFEYMLGLAMVASKESRTSYNREIFPTESKTRKHILHQSPVHSQTPVQVVHEWTPKSGPKPVSQSTPMKIPLPTTHRSRLFQEDGVEYSVIKLSPVTLNRGNEPMKCDDRAVDDNIAPSYTEGNASAPVQQVLSTSGVFSVEEIAEESITSPDVTNTEKCNNERYQFIGEPSHHSTPVKPIRPRSTHGHSWHEDVISPVGSDLKKNESIVSETSVEAHELLVDGPEIRKSIQSIEVTGRRIVDIMHIFKSIQNENHGAGLDCTFMNMDLMQERNKGLWTSWSFKCRVCGISSHIKSEDQKERDNFMDINDAAVHGIIAIGAGYSQLAAFTSAMNMHCMTNKTYAHHFRNVAGGIHDAAWLAMEEAAKAECAIAIHEGNVDKNGTPLCTVVADGAWCKRSYKTKYDSLSGVASIVGYQTQKVLYIGVRNRYCCVCARAKSLQREPTEHICYLNWNQSATSMEADIIAEGFSNSLDMYGLKFDKLIGDGDSSVHKRLTVLTPYGHDLPVEKIECRNHVLRNYCSKIRELSKRTRAGFPPGLRDHLGKQDLRLRTAVTTASRHRQQELGPMHTRIAELRKDIDNGPYHIFGQHDGCQERGYFCDGPKEGETNLVPEMMDCGLFQELLGIVRSSVTRHAGSLILNVSNNVSEQYNSKVARFTGFKGLNYALKGAYLSRCEAAVVSFNKPTQYLTEVHKAMLGKSPGMFTKRFEGRKSRVLENARKRRLEFPETAFRKRCRAGGPDKDYGLQEGDALDMSPDDFERNKNSLLASMVMTESQRQELERRTVGQSQNTLWQRERRKRLTASVFGNICNMRDTTSCKVMVNSMLYAHVTTKAMIHGIQNEPLAKLFMKEEHDIDAQDCGLFIDKDYPFLGASPDGLVGDDSIMEIKCPLSADAFETPKEAIDNGKIAYCDIVDGKLLLKPNKNYYYQIQGQLHITQKQFCYFVIHTKHWTAFEKIERDDDFWQMKMVGKLQRFYQECLLPELVDPQFRKRLIRDDIKDPPRILEAQAEAREKKKKRAI